MLLRHEPGLTLTGESSDAESLVLESRELVPDLILLDWELAGRPSHSLIADLKESVPHLQVIVLSGRPESEKRALAAGADVFVSKTDPPDRLLAAVQGLFKRRQADAWTVQAELE
jgi:DNA-binding NarL/FixJ family response regulator